MSKIISIPNDNDSAMNTERIRIGRWAPHNGWVYIGYNDASDHLAQLGQVASVPVDVLDFICHGEPTSFDHTAMAVARSFGLQLRLVKGVSAQTEVYLDACNTGLTSFLGGPIAQILANGVGCPVYGSQGYMIVGTTYAESNEECQASPYGYASYPGGRDAQGRNVWLRFTPQTEPKATGGSLQLTRTLQILDSHKTGVLGDIRNVIEVSIRGAVTEFPPLRMAPDITLNYITEAGVQVLDVYANCSLLRDRVSGTSWRVANPGALRELLQSALKR